MSRACSECTIVILRHEFPGAVHWYVIFRDKSMRNKKFNHYGDAMDFALLHATPENIEASM